MRSRAFAHRWPATHQPPRYSRIALPPKIATTQKSACVLACMSVAMPPTRVTSNNNQQQQQRSGGAGGAVATKQRARLSAHIVCLVYGTRTDACILCAHCQQQQQSASMHFGNARLARNGIALAVTVQSVEYKYTLRLCVLGRAYEHIIASAQHTQTHSQTHAECLH